MSATKYDICIVGGLGHVGLPLGLALADVGQRVVCYDINHQAIELVSSGRMPFSEDGAEEALKRTLGKTLFVSADKRSIAESHFVVIVIGTPVDEHLNPKFTVFKRFFDELADVVRDDHHLILRSTVFPGTSEKIRAFLQSRGKRPRVSFCPERIAQGKALREIRELPQIVSSFDAASEAEVRDLFLKLTADVIVVEPLEAELAKLFTNSWRYIQFATSNQFYQLATEHGVDFYKIYRAMTHKYPRCADFPAAGFAAGPCLLKDTMQLAAFSNNSFFLGHSAMLINEGLPNFLVQTLKDKYVLRTKTAGILGMAFKANNDDKRDSLSYKLRKILEVECAEVLCTDVFIDEAGFVDPTTLVERSNIILVGAPHREYASLKIGADKVVVDLWNYYGKGGLF
jgi:UDP-N-acetyl-D-mannosaminuronic acid dehydrogenase